MTALNSLREGSGQKRDNRPTAQRHMGAHTCYVCRALQDTVLVMFCILLLAALSHSLTHTHTHTHTQTHIHTHTDIHTHTHTLLNAHWSLIEQCN